LNPGLAGTEDYYAEEHDSGEAGGVLEGAGGGDGDVAWDEGLGVDSGADALFRLRRSCRS
jgi:hypothetical protein